MLPYTMRTLLILLAASLLAGCDSPTSPGYVVPTNISGHWVAEDPEELSGSPGRVVHHEFFLEQDGSEVSGQYFVVFKDGSSLNDSTSGTYDLEQGLLTLFFWPALFGFETQILFSFTGEHFYRFTSDTEMHQVHNPRSSDEYFSKKRYLKFNKVAGFP